MLILIHTVHCIVAIAHLLLLLLFLDTQEDRNFLTILVKYFCEFLQNIKVADSSIPILTMEKVSDLMKKLQDECLAPLGAALQTRKYVRFI
jgi:hypothetical protein